MGSSKRARDAEGSKQAKEVGESLAQLSQELTFKRGKVVMEEGLVQLRIGDLIYLISPKRLNIKADEFSGELFKGRDAQDELSFFIWEKKQGYLIFVKVLLNKEFSIETRTLKLENMPSLASPNDRQKSVQTACRDDSFFMYDEEGQSYASIQDGVAHKSVFKTKGAGRAKLFLDKGVAFVLFRDMLFVVYGEKRWNIVPKIAFESTPFAQPIHEQGFSKAFLISDGKYIVKVGIQEEIANGKKNIDVLYGEGFNTFSNRNLEDAGRGNTNN